MENSERFQKNDEDSCDIRNFSLTTKSQLLTSYAIEKTIKKTMKQKLLTKNENSFSKSLNQSSMSCNSLDLMSRGSGLQPTDIITKFWKSFERYAIAPSGKLGKENSSLALVLPVTSLSSAIQLMSTIDMEVEVSDIIARLGLSEKESLSWVEYRDICSQLFHIVDILPSQLSTLSNPHATESSPSIGSRAYDRLIRIDRTANSIPHSVSEPSLAESYVPEKTSSLKKDSLCFVLKREYRKIRKAEQAGVCPSKLEEIPRYQRDLQKKKLLSILDPREGKPKKWRQIRQLKLNEEAKITRLNHRNALIQHLKTVVVAQDRTGLNQALTAVDLAVEETIDRNMEKRYEEKLRTAHNIETKRYHDAVVKADSADTLKQTLRESSQRARELIHEEKSQRFHALNSMNDSNLLTESRTLSSYTSSKFEVPSDIKNRIQYSKRLSEYKKARQDAKEAYERELSSRIHTYTSKRKEALLKAASTGCLISLNPLQGSDYFESDSATFDAFNDKYFDSSEFIEHLQIGERSGILTAPVFLDPNHQLYHNMSDSIDSTRYTTSRK